MIEMGSSSLIPRSTRGWYCGSPDHAGHRSTFCKVTGESDVTVHWCCPGACELGGPATRTVVESSTKIPDLIEAAVKELTTVIGPTDPPAEDPPRGALRFWSHEGITLPADDRGTIGAADLLEFAQLALKHYPDARIYPHAYGMRVTKSAGDNAPRLDWRDWD